MTDLFIEGLGIWSPFHNVYSFFNRSKGIQLFWTNPFIPV